jgi:hypothetical protein
MPLSYSSKRPATGAINKWRLLHGLSLSVAEITIGAASDYNAGFDLGSAAATRSLGYSTIVAAIFHSLRSAGGTFKPIADGSFDITTAKMRLFKQSVGLANLQRIASVGNGAGAETILGTFTVPANLLFQNGMSLRARAWGTLAANANSKTMNWRLGGIGGTIVGQQITAVNVANNVWVLELFIWRTTAANAQESYSVGETGSSTASQSSVPFFATSALDLTASQDLVITGNGAGASDVVARGMSVELANAALGLAPGEISAIDLTAGDILSALIIGV